MLNASEHFRTCQGCSECRCPHCGSARCVRGKDGVRGAQGCWLFVDAIQSLFLDAEWSRSVMKSQAMRDMEDIEGEDLRKDRPSVARFNEYKRLRKALTDRGHDMQKV